MATSGPWWRSTERSRLASAAWSARRSRQASCTSTGRAASAAGRLAHRVSPPTAGISTAHRIPSDGGAAVQLRSVCQPKPGRRAFGVVLDGRHRAARAEEPVEWRHGERAELLTEAAVLLERQVLASQEDDPVPMDRGPQVADLPVGEAPGEVDPVDQGADGAREGLDAQRGHPPILRPERAPRHRPDRHIPSAVRPMSPQPVDRTHQHMSPARLGERCRLIGEDHRLHAAAHAEFR